MFQADPTDPRHGTENGYQNLHCRCDRCRTANTIYARGRARANGVRTRAEAHAAQRRPLTGPDDPRHGKPNTLRNHGCRCIRCRAAAAEHRRQQRITQREQSAA